MSTPPFTTLTIAVLTYKRVSQIVDLIPKLVEQGRMVDASVRILVVDNDPEAGAREAVVAALGDEGVYVHEAVPGIVAGRNRALAASGDQDLLVFIDDDEVPSARWLAQLVEVYRQADPSVVAVVGSVVSVFEREPEPWVEAGRFFDRRRLATGTEITVAATNNLLLDLRWLRGHGIVFDHRFGLSGGSDTLFSRAIVAQGGRMLWCDEAEVTDEVPVSRITRAWVLQRAYRSGNSWSRTSLALEPSRLGRLRIRAGLLSKGAVRLVGGSAQSLLGRVRGSMRHDARGRRTARRGAGMIAGAFGGVYSEYARASH
ncbi:glycosyltransferase family 2 protein [Plantibacter sp. MPB07]|uniref:glycosyltransferase family 2 protein n=1 Tax=Plantibacter sp. MPB07 TaxID=3388853 RepID=UPI003985C062